MTSLWMVFLSFPNRMSITKERNYMLPIIIIKALVLNILEHLNIKLKSGLDFGAF